MAFLPYSALVALAYLVEVPAEASVVLAGHVGNVSAVAPVQALSRLILALLVRWHLWATSTCLCRVRPVVCSAKSYASPAAKSDEVDSVLAPWARLE